MTKQQIKKAYAQYDKILHQLSHKTAGRCGRPEEDCYGQACFLFMKAATTYKPGRCEFGTWLYACVRNGLATWGAKNPLAVGWENPRCPAGACHISQDSYEEGWDCYPERKTDLSPDKTLMFKDWLADLSEECREVAMIILNGPAEVLEIGAGGCRKITAEMIKAYLRKKNWTYPRIWQTMRDLKEAIRVI